MISIVMPAYNAEQYIEDAIISVQSQTFPKWELIIVDDKSTDKTYEIALKYSNNDSRIRVFQLSENSGSAQKPRLFAEEVARGDFFCVLDADDVLDEDYLEKLYCRQKETNTDIVIGQICGMSEAGEKLDKWNPVPGFDMNSIISGRQAYMYTVGGWTINGLGLFKRAVIENAKKRNGIVESSINADEVYTRLKFLESNAVSFCEANYFYRNNTESITKKFSLKLFGCLDAVDFVYYQTKDLFGEKSRELGKAAGFYFDTVVRCIGIYQLNKSIIEEKDKAVVLNNIKSSWKKISFPLLYKYSSKRGLVYALGYHFTYYLILVRNNVLS